MGIETAKQVLKLPVVTEHRNIRTVVTFLVAKIESQLTFACLFMKRLLLNAVERIEERVYAFSYYTVTK